MILKMVNPQLEIMYPFCKNLFLSQIFIDNFVHGDLHPGNILVERIGHDDFKLVILDTGIASSLSKPENFSSVFTAVVKGDTEEVGRLFLEHSEHECKEPEEFVAEMGAIVASARQQQLSLATVDVSALLQRVFWTLRKHNVKLDASHSSVILAIMVLEGLGRSLDPEMDLIWKATPYLIKGSL